jgi:hypothetical protein
MIKSNCGYESRKCSNCLNKVFDINTCETYCNKGHFEDVCINENIKANNCNDFEIAFFLVKNEVIENEVIIEDLPF